MCLCGDAVRGPQWRVQAWASGFSGWGCSMLRQDRLAEAFPLGVTIVSNLASVNVA